MATKRYRRTCTVCGKEYEFCPDCREYALQPSWKNIYHDENCREIAHILTAVGRTITAEEAKEKIAKCDLTNKDNFNEVWRKPLFELLGINEKIEEPKVEEPKVEEKIEEPKVGLKVEEIKIEEKAAEPKEDVKTEETKNDYVSEISNFKKKNKKRK